MDQVVICKMSEIFGDKMVVPNVWKKKFLMGGGKKGAGR